MVCTPSDDNILGPYYRPNAPFRDDLTERGTLGTRVTVEGRVVDAACQPLAGALIDLWQADDEGGYDNDGKDDPAPEIFVLRGRLYTGSDGRYSFRTIIPGRYLNGQQYRPAHVHVRVSAPGFAQLTTQLYFEGDPYNDIDPFIKDSLIMPLTDVGSEKEAKFDFVLVAS
jgi:protocatechuate 3,4-dioxygenase beta subunit